jgi:hypothetical protein
MLTTILICVTLTFFVVFLIALRNLMIYEDDEEEVVTTTTTTFVGDDIPVVGMLHRQYRGGQPYVIDPIDKAEWWLNTNDTHYEDAAGNWWKLN